MHVFILHTFVEITVRIVLYHFDVPHTLLTVQLQSWKHGSVFKRTLSEDLHLWFPPPIEVDYNPSYWEPDTLLWLPWAPSMHMRYV